MLDSASQSPNLAFPSGTGQVVGSAEDFIKPRDDCEY